jgi:hypothetical protein
MFKLYQASAYNPDDGKIVLKPKYFTAKTDQSARDKAILELPSGTDLDVVKVIVTPLG